MKTLRILSILIFTLALTLSNFNAPLAVRAATVGCTASSPASAAYMATICITSPANGASLTGNATVTGTVSVTGTNPGVQRMVFNLGSSYLLTDYSSPYTFSLPSTKWADGNYTLSASALMRDGFTSAQASIKISFKNGNVTDPINTNHFTPSKGRAAGGQPFVVVASGDGASGEAASTKVVNTITSLNPNLFLYLGDVYENGSRAEFYNWYGNASSNFSVLRAITDPTIGNHEYNNGINGAGYFDYWNNIPNYYSFNAGGWHFISLNSNASKIKATPTSAQYLWLQQDLTANAHTCTIAYYHQPLFNIGAEGPATSMSSVWALLASYGVSMVLNGHDHDYQRWVPLDASGQPSASGITEFVAGGAGHGLQNFITTDSRVAYSNDLNPTAFGVLLLQLGSTGANFSYHSSNGAILDSGFVPCNPTVPPGSTPTATPTETRTPTRTPTPTPTATVTPKGVIFTPVADTYVNAGSKGTNYGATTTLRLDSSPNVDAYLRFKVSGLSKIISQVHLLLYSNNSDSAGIRAWAVANNTWGELTTNYTNAPALGRQLASSGAFASGKWVSLDITAYVTGNGTYSFGVTNLSSTVMSVMARESGAHAPELIIVLK